MAIMLVVILQMVTREILQSTYPGVRWALIRPKSLKKSFKFTITPVAVTVNYILSTRLICYLKANIKNQSQGLKALLYKFYAQEALV